MITRLIVLLAVIAALAGVWNYIDSRGYARAKAECNAAITSEKHKAATKLASETAKIRAAEQALQAATDSQNLKDAENAEIKAAMSDQLRRAAGPAGRLRDPHATSGCGCGGGGATGAPAAGAGDRAADAAEAGGLLSVPLTDLLTAVLRESDAISAAYASCRADAYSVRQAQDTEYRLPGM